MSDTLKAIGPITLARPTFIGRWLIAPALH